MIYGIHKNNNMEDYNKTLVKLFLNPFLFVYVLITTGMCIDYYSEKNKIELEKEKIKLEILKLKKRIK